MKNEETNQGRVYFSQPNDEGVRYFDISGTKSEFKSRSSLVEKKRPMWKNLLIILGIFVGIMIICSIFSAGNDSDGAYATLPKEQYIAEIFVEGTIAKDNVDYFGSPVGYQHDWTIETINALIQDENNKGMIIFVDSPGGTIYESDELYLKIKEYKEKTNRPVYSVMGSIAASGGYYISAPADKIYANRNTWTGSIGVTIGNIFDVSEFLNQHGIKVKTITSGENKAMGSNFQEMTAEEEAIWRSLVMEAYEQFVSIVAEGRNLDVEYVRTVADGRIYSAKQALEIKLIDEIGGVDDAYKGMLEENEIDGCILEEMKFEVEGSLFSSVLSGIANTKSKSDAEALLNYVESNGGYPASYICEALAQ